MLKAWNIHILKFTQVNSAFHLVARHYPKDSKVGERD